MNDQILICDPKIAMYTFAEISSWVSKPWKNLPETFQGLEQNVPRFGICHDTRTLKEGDVYIAIKGENLDGHDFVEQAVEKGAAGLIVEREFPASLACASKRLANIACPEPSRRGKPQLVVPDTMEALWRLAAGVRREWTGTVIGITGSVGKTTVKEMLASVLSQKGTVAKTPGNWNNDIGLPLSMLAADRAADYFVFELGMNHPGEIDRLAGLLKPDWGLITAIGKAHTEFFESLEEIADEKASILRHARNALLDQDSEWFERIETQFPGTVVTLTEEPFTAPQPGAHMVQNMRFAATIGVELGLSHAEIQRGLDLFENAPMRWQTIEKNGVFFINDAYNANPLSMRAAISTFAELPCEGRKFLVLGGMRELGESAAEEHRLLRAFVDSMDLDRAIYVGSGWTDGIEKNACGVLLRDQLNAGDMVLFKASRGEKLETILEEITINQ